MFMFTLLFFSLWALRCNPDVPRNGKGKHKTRFSHFLEMLFRYFNMIGDTMMESQTPLEQLVENMKKRKIADYFQDCLCTTENNHRLCDLIMSKFYQLSGFTKIFWKSERLESLNKIDLDHFAVTVFQWLLRLQLLFLRISFCRYLNNSALMISKLFHQK